MKKDQKNTELIKTINPMFLPYLGYSLGKSGILYRSIIESELKKYNIVFPQMGILYFLEKEHRDCNQLSLCQEMHIDKASMVKFIDGLEEEGFVERRVNPSDRRAKLVSITDKGLKFKNEIVKVHDILEKKILKDFSKDDIDQLKRIMPKVLEAILKYRNDLDD